MTSTSQFMPLGTQANFEGFTASPCRNYEFGNSCSIPSFSLPSSFVSTTWFCARVGSLWLHLSLSGSCNAPCVCLLFGGHHFGDRTERSTCHGARAGSWFAGFCGRADLWRPTVRLPRRQWSELVLRGTTFS